jgi:hypothetical protein
MTHREEYDALAAELRAKWEVATAVSMTGGEWDLMAAQARVGQEKLERLDATFQADEPALVA